MTTIKFNINEKDKRDFIELCDYLGIKPTTAIRMFIKQSIRDNKLPINNHFYSLANIEYLEHKLISYKSNKLKLEEHDLINI